MKFKHSRAGRVLPAADQRSGDRRSDGLRSGGHNRECRGLHQGARLGAWLGLVPKQLSTGDRTILGRLSKRGNKYVRTLFIIGARAVLAKPGSSAKFGLEGWLAGAAKRLHHNVLAAALANKLARIAWSVLYHGRSFARASSHSPSRNASHVQKLWKNAYPGLRGDLKRLPQRSPQRT